MNIIIVSQRITVCGLEYLIMLMIQSYFASLFVASVTIITNCYRKCVELVIVVG